MNQIRINILVFILMPLSGFGQIGAKAQQTKLQGTWVNNDFGFQMILMLNHDGTGEFDGEVVKYTTQADKLIISQQSTATTYEYKLQPNSLLLSGGDVEKPITFSQQGSTTSVTNDAVPDPARPTSKNIKNIPGELLGSWTGYNETIEFKTDGVCLYRGQPFPYSVFQNQITLETAQGNLPMAYAIFNSQLNLTINGKTITYTKGIGNSLASSVEKSSLANKRVDPALVGKWCYVNVTTSNTGGTSTDECITLNADGSYDYYSERSMSANTPDFSAGTASQNNDKGSWWVEGDRVFYNSQIQGDGSYHLQKINHPKNNDPMIVLEGKSYVTFYQKPPW